MARSSKWNEILGISKNNNNYKNNNIDKSHRQMEQLITLLSTHNKSLIVEQSLSSTINYLVPFSQLKSSTNITNVYWFNSSLNDLSMITNNFTFLINSSLTNIPILNTRIKELLNLNHTIQIDLILTSDYFNSFQFELEAIGLLGDINSIKKWDLYLHDPSSNLYQLDLNKFDFNSLYLYKTSNIPFKLAYFLNNYIQSQPRLKITHILAKGSNSSKFVQIYKELRKNSISELSLLEKQRLFKLEKGLYGKDSNNSGKQTDLIVLERNLDFLSVVLNQLSYVGIIDEFYDIDINSIKLQAEDGENEEVIFLESSKDSIYDDIKYKNFGIACDYLNLKAKELQLQYDELNKNKNLLETVENLKKLEDLKKQVLVQTKISESIINKINNNASNNEDSKFNQALELQQDIILENVNYSTTIAKIQEMILQEFDVKDVLRIIAVASIVNNGLKEKDFNRLTNDIIERFGFKYFKLLKNFITIGLISIRGDPTIIKNFQSLNSKLQMIPTSEPPREDEDSLSYRGYTPLITKLLEIAFKKDSRSSWSSIDLNNLLLGKTIDEELTQSPKESIGLGGLIDNDNLVIIVMIGGLTYSELSSLKFLEKKLQKKGMHKKFIILTDSMINANDLIEVNLK